LLHTKFEVFSISQSCPRAISIRKKKIKKEENTNKEEKAQKEELKVYYVIFRKILKT